MPASAVWIDNARIVAIAAVVLLHVAVVVLNDQVTGSDGWWSATLLYSAVRWGVPVFVIVSGATLLGYGKVEQPGTFYRKRMSRILIPVLFWSAFYVLWAAAKPLAKGQAVNWEALFLSWAAGRPAHHLWFMYMIVGLYLITPWLRRAMQDMPTAMLKWSALGLMALVAVDLLARQFGLANGPPSFLLWFVEYIPYFLLGAYALRHMPEQVAQPARAWACLAVVAVVMILGYPLLITHGEPDWAAYWHENLGVAVIATTLALLPILRSWRRPLLGARTAKVAGYTFGIYLVHLFLLSILMLTRWHREDLSGISAAALVLGWTAAVLLMSYVMTVALSKVPGLRRLV